MSSPLRDGLAYHYRMLTMRHSVYALILATGLATPATAQTNAQVDADAKEIASYRLTMESIRKLDVAMRAAFAEMEKDPKYQALRKVEEEIEAIEKKEETTEAEDARIEALREQKEKMEAENDTDLGDAKTLSEMEAQVRKVPAMARALASAGLAPREYSKIMMAMVPAAMAAGMKKSGLLKTLPKEFNAENVKFIEDHEAELTAMQKGWQAMGGKKGQ